MRTALALLAAATITAPAAAQSQTRQPVPDVQRALADPATADKLTNVMQALSKAFLDLPVGPVEAAVEGRAPTPAERKLTVRDLGHRDDPSFDRNLQRQIAQSKPMIQGSMKALSEALPALMRSLDDAGRAIDRAAANLPDPTYPKR